MTSANPLRVLKRQIDAAFNRAYHVKKLRGTDAICEDIYKEVMVVISPVVQKQALLTLIRDMMVNRLEQMNAFDERDAAPNLFRDLDYQFTFKEGGEQVQCVLGDIDYRRGLSLMKRKESNITAAIHARDEFGRVWSLIGPLLRQNPDWVWRDAVQYLREHGGVPDAEADAVA